MFDIVRASDEHWPLVREIRLRALSADPAAFGGSSWEKESTYDETQWREHIRSIAWFLALDDDELPVGIVASQREADASDSERELQGMWVQSNFRGKGVAAALAEALFEWAKADGADTVTLYVHPNNKPAVALYDYLGFANTGELWQVDEDDPSASWHKMSRAL